MTAPFADRRCPFDATPLDRRFTYLDPPDGEARFPRTSGAHYRREIAGCPACGHLVSIHAMDLNGLYGGDYVDATYGADEARLREAFDRINALEPARSDNVGRVHAVLNFAQTTGRMPGSRAPALLDVGSGLCVFAARMKAEGWNATVLDPDPRAAEHARRTVGVTAVCGDFMTADVPQRFELVAFNKVLEHVIDPVAMLARSKRYIADGGFVYVEVPDGEAAAREGQGREEFFIDHWHVFSPASLAMLVMRAGFSLARLERLREPSRKFTLRAFLTTPHL